MKKVKYLLFVSLLDKYIRSVLIEINIINTYFNISIPFQTDDV